MPRSSRKVMMQSKIILLQHLDVEITVCLLKVGCELTAAKSASQPLASPVIKLRIRPNFAPPPPFLYAKHLLDGLADSPEQ